MSWDRYLFSVFTPELTDWFLHACRFDESRLQTKLTSDRETKLIHSLHDILRPFLLRRMKADVEMALPPKKEYVLYTPLSEPQRALYDVVVQGDKALRQHLIDEIRAEEERLNGGGRKVSDDEEERPLQHVAKEKARAGKGLRQKVERHYVESSDDDGEGYFKRLDEGQIQVRKERERSGQDIGREWQMRAAGAYILIYENGSREEFIAEFVLTVEQSRK